MEKLRLYLHLSLYILAILYILFNGDMKLSFCGGSVSLFVQVNFILLLITILLFIMLLFVSYLSLALFTYSTAFNPVISLLDYLMDSVLLIMWAVQRKTVFCSSLILMICCLGSCRCSFLFPSLQAQELQWSLEQLLFHFPCFLYFDFKIFVLREISTVFKDVFRSEEIDISMSRKGLPFLSFATMSGCLLLSLCHFGLARPRV